MLLSIIIVSYNTSNVTERCLVSLHKNLRKYPLDYEVIVVDNNSKDDSLRMLDKLSSDWKELKIIKSKTNLGFGRANNLGSQSSNGQYILYLNSDAIVTNIDFRDLIDVMDLDKKIGAMTVKVVLSNGQIDPASHRGFPTLWRSFTYFLGLERLFYHTPFLNKIFGGYHLAQMNLNEIHEIDSPTGAFYLTKKEIVDEFGGFDKDYFAYGEDLEMSYQIKQLGYKIIYYPLWKAVHLKSLSGRKKKDHEVRLKTNDYFYNAMKVFYKKHYAARIFYPINQLVYLTIDLKKYFDNR